MKYLIYALVAAIGASVLVGTASESQTGKIYRSDVFIARQVSETVSAYEAVHHRFPDADHWEEELRPYWFKRFSKSVKLTHIPGKPDRRFAMNIALSGKPIARVSNPSNVVLFYETHAYRKDASGVPPANILTPSSDGRRMIWVTADGSIPW